MTHKKASPHGQEETKMANNIPLPDAAKRLSISWERAWRALLKGHLEGEKRDGRWHVTLCSVTQYGNNDQPARGSRAISSTDE